MFLAAWAGLLGWLVLLNAPHLGANAALHWDAEASITWGPAVGSRAELADARRHLYDALDHVLHRDDPAAVTDYYWTDAGLPFHESLTRCRYYYSWASDVAGHAAFDWGRRHLRTPTAAVLCYQLTATAATAASLAGLLTYAVVTLAAGPRVAVRLAVVGLTFAAISSAPVMLSVARQVLQETAGFTFATATLLAFVAGVRRPTASAVVAMSVAGAMAFLTVRSRYTLGPALGLLLPLAWGLSGGPSPRGDAGRRRVAVLAVAFAVPFAVGVALDVRRFGPFVWPWVYDEVMVRSSRLFFHADPPYTDFLIAAFINLPLLVLPTLGVWCWADAGRGRPAWRAYAVLVLVVLAALLWRTAAQQVKFQGRHLFAITDAAVMLWLLVLPRVRWRAASGALYCAVAAFFLVWNCCSTFGSQRAASLVRPPAKLPDAVTVVARHLSTAGAGDTRSLARDLWPAYFDWADSRLLHDTLTGWDYVHRAGGNPLVVVDAAASNANQFYLYAEQFPAFDWCLMHGRSDGPSLARARAALAAGRPTFLLTAPGRRPPAGVADVGPPLDVDLMRVALRRVSAVSPAAVDLDAGSADTATADGLTVTRVAGTPCRFDVRYGYLPHVQQEWLTFDGDPARVAYDVTGLRPGGGYVVGLTMYDPDGRGRSMAVSAEADGVTTTLLSAAAVAAHLGGQGAAPTDVTASLPPAAGGRVRVVVTGRAVAVCEAWVARVR